MKNFLKLLGIIAIIAVIGFSIAACGDNGDYGNGSSVSTTATYTAYDADGNAYTLVITKAATNPQSGDSYVLTITSPSNVVIGTSTGTVSTVSGSTLTLQKGESTFTLTVIGSTIANIPDPIPLDAGGTKTPPDALTPPSLDVNAGSEFRDATHCASGSLYGVVEDIPLNLEELVKPLNPNMFLKHRLIR